MEFTPERERRENIKASSFSSIQKGYNSLLADFHVKGASTLSAFKGSLGDFLNQIPDMPPSTGYAGVNNNSILDWAKQNNRI